MKTAALLFVIIGALNWGSIGLFGLDLVGFVCGGTYSMISRIIFSVVGISGIYLAISSFMGNNK